MEKAVLSPWLYVFFAATLMGTIYFLYALVTTTYKKMEHAAFYANYNALKNQVCDLNVTKQNFGNIKLMFDSISCSSEEQMKYVDPLWITFLQRFAPVHDYPEDEYNLSLDNMIKKRLENKLKIIDQELNKLQEKQTELIHQRKKSSELQETQEAYQLLLHDYDLYSELISAEEPAKKSKSRIKKVTQQIQTSLLL